MSSEEQDNSVQGPSNQLLDVLSELLTLPAEAQQDRMDGLGLSPEQRRMMEEWLRVQTQADGFLQDQTHDIRSIVMKLESDLITLGATPEQIGNYRVLEKIGEGGMAIVFKAEQLRPVRRMVALKVIKPGLESKEIICRFEAERQALAMMNHPNVAKVFDAGINSDGRPYFVMEYVPGEPITAYCDRHKLTIRQRLQLFIHACDAVHHSHQKAIIHRDIKPSNVLVMVSDGKPVVKVIDFGVAKALDHRLTEHTLFTERGQIIGTPEYMSPEQAEMGALDVDIRTDIYSLGVLLYELLAGVLPFDSKQLREAGFGEMQRVIREAEPLRPSARLCESRSVSVKIAQARATEAKTLCHELRKELDWIPLKAIRKDRTERYRSAAEIADDIHNYLHSRPLLAGPESASYRLRKFMWRNRVAIITTTAFFAVIGLAVLIYVIGIHLEQKKTKAALDDAKTQADISRSIEFFLERMLMSPDPDNQLGDKVTVVQVMISATKQLDAGALERRPLVAASVRLAIGRTLMSLARYPEAESNLRKSLELRRASLASDDLGIAEIENFLGQLCYQLGRAPEAEGYLRDALRIFKKSPQVPDSGVVWTMGNLAQALQDQGKLAEAESMFREALKIRRQIYAGPHSEIAINLNNLGTLLLIRGKPSDAEAELLQALEMFQQVRPPGHPDVASALSNLGEALEEQEKLEEAKPYLEKALKIARGAYPATHPSVATCVNNLAALLYRLGKFREAEPLFRESLQTRRETLPKGHRAIAIAAGNLGLVLKDEGKFDEAKLRLQEALDIYRAALPAGKQDVARGMNNLATAFQASGEPGEAEPLFLEALRIWLLELPPDHPDVAQCRYNLAWVLIAQDRVFEAEPLLREVMKSRKKGVGPTSPAMTARLLADLLQRTDRPEESEELMRYYDLLGRHPATQPTKLRF